MKIRNFADETQAINAGRRLKDVGGVSFGRILEDAITAVPDAATVESSYVGVPNPPEREPRWILRQNFKDEDGGVIRAVDITV